MGWLRRLLRPDHSLILLEDPFEPESFETFRDKLSEIQKYYEVVPGETFLDCLTRKDSAGYALVGLRSARVGTFQLAIPYLEEEKIPYTLFVDVESVGTNRLSSDEESLLRKEGHLPLDKLKPSRFMVTWGKIEKLNPNCISVGLRTNAESFNVLQEQYTFLKTQVSLRISPVLLTSRSNLDRDKLQSLGFRGAVGNDEGFVKYPVKPFQMPYWTVTNS